MIAQNKRLLLIEDNPGDARILQNSLPAGGDFQLQIAHTFAAGLRALQESNPDLVLLDLSLPDSPSEQTINRARESFGEIPYIVFTGREDESLASEALRQGAQDYLVKGRFDADLVQRSIKYAIQRHRFESLISRERVEKEVLQATEEVERRIGQDLHDSIQGTLSGVHFMLDALRKDITTDQLAKPEIVAKLAELQTIVRDTINQTRGIARGLAPANLENEGFAKALADLAQTTERIFEIPCRLEAPRALRLRDAKAAGQLYYLTLEALNNAVRHGEPSAITIRFQEQPGAGAFLAIEDNGTGIPLGAESAYGLGLRTMRSRARMIGAQLDIQCTPTGGTLVLCTLPQEAILSA